MKQILDSVKCNLVDKLPARNITLLSNKQLLQEIKNCFTKTIGYKIEESFFFVYEVHSAYLKKTKKEVENIHLAHILATELQVSGNLIIASLLLRLYDSPYFKKELIVEKFGLVVWKLIAEIKKTEKLFVYQKKESLEHRLKIIYEEIHGKNELLIFYVASNLMKMRFSCSFPEKEHMRIAIECSLIYLPIAQRLGLDKVKRELDTLALKYLQPFSYFMIEEKMSKIYKMAAIVMKQFEKLIGNSLLMEGIDYQMDKRVKSYPSIWRKMQEKNRKFEDLHDILAVRVIIKNKLKKEEEAKICWKVYQIITKFYKPVLNRIHDWIGYPKPNGYQSLHVTFAMRLGIKMEVQIRTERMHKVAQSGPASHIRYKEDKDRKVYQKIFKEWEIRCKD